MTIGLPAAIAASACAMPAAGMAGRLDHDLDLVAARRRPAARRRSGSRPIRAGVPADAPAGRARPLRVEVGDRRHLEPGSRRHLRRGTSSRTCRRRSGRPGPAARRRPGRRACASGSSRLLGRDAGARARTAAARRRRTGSIGVKSRCAIHGSPGELGDVVRDRAQRQVDDLARVGRDVGRRGVDQVAVEHQHRAGLAGRRHDARRPSRAG